MDTAGPVREEGERREGGTAGRCFVFVRVRPNGIASPRVVVVVVAAITPPILTLENNNSFHVAVTHNAPSAPPLFPTSLRLSIPIAAAVRNNNNNNNNNNKNNNNNNGASDLERSRVEDQDQADARNHRRLESPSPNMGSAE